MSVAVSVVIAATDFELGTILASDGVDAQFELSQVVPIDGGLMPYVWVTHDSDLETFERGVRDDPRVARLMRVDGDLDRVLYRIEWSTEDERLDGFSRALSEHSILVERATCAGNEWQFRLRANSSESLSAFYHACTDVGIQLDIRQVQHDATIEEPDRYGLTPKQAEALSLAFEQGHFRIPRGATQGELAETIGLSRQAFARRLQRALDTLVANTFMSEQTPHSRMENNHQLSGR